MNDRTDGFVLWCIFGMLTALVVVMLGLCVQMDRAVYELGHIADAQHVVASPPAREVGR